MKYVYFDFLICWLILLIFYWVSARYCLRIPNRSKAAFHLGIMFIVCGVNALAYFLSGAIYHPIAAVHRYFTILFMNLVQIHVTQFFFCFPDDDTPRFRRGLFITQYIVAFLITALFIFKSVSAEYVFHFDGHYWDFQLNELSRLVGLVILIFLLIAVLTGFYRAIVNRKKGGFWIFIISLLFLVVSLVPAILNILSRDGAVGRDVYVISMLFLNLTGFVGIFIVFSNLTKDRTTFMSKIMTIMMVTILLLMLGITYYSSVISERSYDKINLIQTGRVLSDKNYRPGDIEYIARYDAKENEFEILYSGAGTVAPRLSAVKAEAENSILYEQIVTMKGDAVKEQLFKKLKGSHSFFAGYKKALTGFAETLSEGDPDYSKKIKTKIDTLNKAALRLRNKINDVPVAGFDGGLKKLLSKEKDPAGAPFRETISSHLDKTAAKDTELRAEILQYVAPMVSPETRHYRHDDRDLMRNYISYMSVDTGSNTAYDVGFSYIKYREFLSPDARNLVFILIGLFLIVTFLFPYFFSGSLVRPLNSLLDGVREIRNGNLDVAIPIHVEDEIGFLTHNFNDMATTIKKSNEQIQDYATNLEQKVQERTEELKTANEELEAMNDTLTQTRDALWGEMQLAKKIQTVLLPEKPEIDGFEISAYLAPTDEVGGDYYDVINFEGFDWLVIGDVSGHGVSAGLIMMMVQTSIRSVLIGEPGLQPEVLLNRVNKVITENIRKLGENKYMTITVIACMKEGMFFYSGLHQDIMIYRAAANNVDLVETKGMWIGVSKDLQGMIGDDQFLLKSGDVMLLYTDGITEARKSSDNAGGSKNDEEMFGDVRLKNCFASLGRKRPEEIKQGILNELKGYHFDDDITILIAKKK